MADWLVLAVGCDDSATVALSLDSTAWHYTNDACWGAGVPEHWLWNDCEDRLSPDACVEGEL